MILKNVKHEAFCQEMAKGVNHGQAYINAGYRTPLDDARKHASRLMTKDNIKARLSQLQEKTNKRYDLSKEAIMKYVDIVIRDCMKDSKGGKDKDGNIIEPRIDNMNLLKSIDIMNKMGGNYSETINNKLEGEITNTVINMIPVKKK